MHHEDTGMISVSGRISPLRLFDRRLDHYPEGARRYGLLALVVLSTITLYYEQYVQGAVSPSVLTHFHISFRWYLSLIVVSNAAGAMASLFAGLADRWGRANLVVGGLFSSMPCSPPWLSRPPPELSPTGYWFRCRRSSRASSWWRPRP